MDFILSFDKNNFFKKISHLVLLTKIRLWKI